MKLIKRAIHAIGAHLDMPLLFIVLALMGIGLLTVFSATSSDGFQKLDKQIITSETFTALLLMAVASTMLTVPVVFPRLQKMQALLTRSQ